MAGSRRAAQILLFRSQILKKVQESDAQFTRSKSLTSVRLKPTLSYGEGNRKIIGSICSGSHIPRKLNMSLLHARRTYSLHSLIDHTQNRFMGTTVADSVLVPVKETETDKCDSEDTQKQLNPKTAPCKTQQLSFMIKNSKMSNDSNIYKFDLFKNHEVKNCFEGNCVGPVFENCIDHLKVKSNFSVSDFSYKQNISHNRNSELDVTTNNEHISNYSKGNDSFNNLFWDKKIVEDLNLDGIKTEENSLSKMTHYSNQNTEDSVDSLSESQRYPFTVISWKNTKNFSKIIEGNVKNGNNLITNYLCNKEKMSDIQETAVDDINTTRKELNKFAPDRSYSDDTNNYSPNKNKQNVFEQKVSFNTDKDGYSITSSGSSMLYETFEGMNNMDPNRNYPMNQTPRTVNEFSTSFDIDPFDEMSNSFSLMEKSKKTKEIMEEKNVKHFKEDTSYKDHVGNFMSENTFSETLKNTFNKDTQCTSKVKHEKDRENRFADIRMYTSSPLINSRTDITHVAIRKSETNKGVKNNYQNTKMKRILLDQRKYRALKFSQKVEDEHCVISPKTIFAEHVVPYQTMNNEKKADIPKAEKLKHLENNMHFTLKEVENPVKPITSTSFSNNSGKKGDPKEENYICSETTLNVSPLIKGVPKSFLTSKLSENNSNAQKIETADLQNRVINSNIQKQCMFNDVNILYLTPSEESSFLNITPESSSKYSQFPKTEETLLDNNQHPPESSCNFKGEKVVDFKNIIVSVKEDECNEELNSQSRKELKFSLQPAENHQMSLGSEFTYIVDPYRGVNTRKIVNNKKTSATGNQSYVKKDSNQTLISKFKPSNTTDDIFYLKNQNSNITERFISELHTIGKLTSEKSGNYVAREPLKKKLHNVQSENRKMENMKRKDSMDTVKFKGDSKLNPQVNQNKFDYLSDLSKPVAEVHKQKGEENEMLMKKDDYGRKQNSVLCLSNYILLNTRNISFGVPNLLRTNITLSRLTSHHKKKETAREHHENKVNEKLKSCKLKSILQILADGKRKNKLDLSSFQNFPNINLGTKRKLKVKGINQLHEKVGGNKDEMQETYATATHKFLPKSESYYFIKSRGNYKSSLLKMLERKNSLKDMLESTDSLFSRNRILSRKQPVRDSRLYEYEQQINEGSRLYNAVSKARKMYSESESDVSKEKFKIISLPTLLTIQNLQKKQKSHFRREEPSYTLKSNNKKISGLVENLILTNKILQDNRSAVMKNVSYVPDVLYHKYLKTSKLYAAAGKLSEHDFNSSSKGTQVADVPMEVTSISRESQPGPDKLHIGIVQRLWKNIFG